MNLDTGDQHDGRSIASERHLLYVPVPTNTCTEGDNSTLSKSTPVVSVYAIVIGHRLCTGVKVNLDTQVVVRHVHYCVQISATDAGLSVELCDRGGGGVRVAIAEAEG